MDKNRFGREVPLSKAARAALDLVCPDVGLLFGSHDYRRLLREASKAAGIDEYRAARISDYDLRHSRLTHLGQVSSNLSGVMFLAGHKQPATTACYLRPQKQATAEVFDAAAAPTIPVAFRSQRPLAALPGESGLPEKHQRFRMCARAGTRTPMDVIH